MEHPGQSWKPFIDRSYDKLVKENNTKELGKFLANANEHMQVSWINSNTSLSVKLRDDDDHNGTGYDLISESGMRIQSKYRGGKNKSGRPSLFIEQTRRGSKKNEGAASRTGHVVPAVGECDVYLFTVPDNSAPGNLAKVARIAIPEDELKDPTNPGFLVPRVAADLQDKYKGRAKEVLESLENSINA